MDDWELRFTQWEEGMASYFGGKVPSTQEYGAYVRQTPPPTRPTSP